MINGVFLGGLVLCALFCWQKMVKVADFCGFLMFFCAMYMFYGAFFCGNSEIVFFFFFFFFFLC